MLDIRERIALRFTVGRPFGSPARHLCPPLRSYRPGMIREVTRDGLSWRLDPSDWSQYKTFFGWLLPDHEAILDLIPTGSRVVDVGANFGAIALRAAAMGCKVTAIEAAPEMHAALVENVRLNDVDIPVEVHHAAASSRTGSVGLRRRVTENSGSTQVLGHGAVQSVRLDDLVEAADVIKIDVEGHEHEVLRGAERLLATSRPLLIVEVNDQHLRDHGSSTEGLVAWLAERGYEGAPLPGQERQPADYDAVFHHNSAASS